MRPIAPLSALALLGLAGLSLAACDSSPRPSQAGLYTSDDRCIRERQRYNEPLFETVHECGMEVPDLSNDPDLQRWAAVNGQAYLKTEIGQDSREHWFYCRLTGYHPGNEPTATSPFRCKALGFTTPLDMPHDKLRPSLTSAG